MIEEINIYNFSNALNVADDNRFDTEDIIKDLKKFKVLAFNYTDQYRKAKNDFMNDLELDVRGSEGYKLCYNEIIKICDKYGRRSFTFNTLVRSISMVQKTKVQVKRERLLKRNLPPAFDSSIRAERSKSREELKKEILKWLEVSSDSFVWELKKLIQKEWNKLKGEDLKIELLTNGTTTMIQWKEFNINDILSVVFCPDCVLDTEVSQLGLRLRVANRYSEDDGFVYIKLGDSEIYSECGGEHLEIPDKDAKTREIYRMFPWVQVVSKKLHKLLDRVARVLEGNYTYKHREWIKNLVRNNWNNTKYIIGADMTKYSDTLDRDFIVDVLTMCGLPKQVGDLIYKLYGMSIYDSTLVEILKGSQASYQGQYGDFPMITICNLVLQRFLYHKVDQVCSVGYNAAVGDDTGLVFDKYDPRIMDTMIEVYGAVGVNINRDKTGELIYGKGRIDFVKLEVDNVGVIEFLNMRSWNEKNIDSLVRDIMDLMYVSDNKRWNITEAMFGPGSGNRLKDLSIINGGIKDEPISRRDIALYVSRSQKIHNLTEYKPDETHMALLKIKDYLKDDYCPGETYYLGDTALRGYLEDEDYRDCNDDCDRLDERIIQRIMNMVSIGLNQGTYKNLSSWIGKIPSETRREYDKMMHGEYYNEELSAIWSEISSYETFAAKRKGVEAKKSRRISTMLPVLNGFYDAIEEVDVPSYIMYEDKQLKASQDYNKMMRSYRANQNTSLILEKLKGVLRLSWEEYFGINYRYAYINLGTHEIKRRVYGVEYYSKYEPISEIEFNTYLLPHLKGLNVSYTDMLINFKEADNLLWSYKDPLTKLGL